MSHDIRDLQSVKRLMIARYPRFAQEIANTSLLYKKDLPYKTAATDGKNIYFDPDYLASLNDEEKLFIIAHELMHIKFEHMFRMVDKNGLMRDIETWNIATDAIINANLELDGFKIKDGYINMPEAINYNSEDFYEKLLKEKQQNQQSDNGQNQNEKQSQTVQEQNQNQQNVQNENTNGQNQSDEQDSANEQNSSKLSQNGDQDQVGQGSNRQNMDDHSLWEEAFEETKKSNKGQKQHSFTPQPNQQTDDKNIKVTPNENEIEFEEVNFDEKSEFQQNREERREIARQRYQKLKDKELKKTETGNIEFGEVGEAKPILDWKLLLRREIERAESVWSQRRSIAENNYAYRLEENDIEDESLTEVMIDVSGSVSLNMVKAFLRQLKPILKESKLRVGCFNAKFWGMVDIKSNRDIDNFKIPLAARDRSSAWTEDWDLAVRSFTQKPEINKIVFTDGEPCPGTMPKPDLKDVNVIWLVYSNRNFNPCCGKVIFVSEKDFNKLNIKDNDKNDLSM